MITQGAGPQVKVVSLHTRFVAAPASAELQALIVHDSHGNLVLDGENIRHPPVEPAGPQWEIVTYSHQLDVNAQLLPVAKDRTFQNVVGLHLLSGVTNIARPSNTKG
jgi:hypothetical protein